MPSITLIETADAYKEQFKWVNLRENWNFLTNLKFI